MKPRLSIVPITKLIQKNVSQTSAKESVPITKLTQKNVSQTRAKEGYLLPSKTEGNSEIFMAPVKRERKSCGHYGPCESLVCEVAFHRVAENNVVSPVIAVNIDKSEIDARVTKHCKNDLCDALSIDHDRCRQAIIRCHRCDLTNACDICLNVLKTRKARMNHKNCKMRFQYRHNKTTRAQILRHRMRHRELQILDEAKLRKTDYMNPVNGHERAIESLQNNEELIVIPKGGYTIQQHPTIRITSVTGATISKPETVENDGKLISNNTVGSVPQVTLMGKRPGTESTGSQLPVKLARSGNPEGVPILPAYPQTNSLIVNSPVCTNNLMQQVQFISLQQFQSGRALTTQSPTNSFIMPIRLVAISGLMPENSSPQQTQSILKFRVVNNTTNQPQTLVDSLPNASSTPKLDKIVVKTETNGGNQSKKSGARTDHPVKRIRSGGRRSRRKKGAKKMMKSFECTFCFKRFSTDWYFKLHVAKHKGEIKYTCKFCKKPFMHLFNMTKHVAAMHKNEDTADDAAINEEGDEKIGETEVKSLQEEDDGKGKDRENGFAKTKRKSDGSENQANGGVESCLPSSVPIKTEPVEVANHFDDEVVDEFDGEVAENFDGEVVDNLDDEVVDNLDDEVVNGGTEFEILDNVADRIDSDVDDEGVGYADEAVSCVGDEVVSYVDDEVVSSVEVEFDNNDADTDRVDESQTIILG